MKTLHEARLSAEANDIVDKYLYVTAVLMAKLVMEKQREFAHERSRTYTFNEPNFNKFHLN